MFIDRGHRVWIVATTVALLIATACYVAYVRSAPNGPQGGSWQGLCFGIAGTLLMLYAGLLSARKKMPRVRAGTALTWLKGHVWMGLLSVPLIFFHAGFRWGGLVEQLLMVVYLAVVVSGIAGLAFQRYLPGLIRSSVPREATFEQIPHVCRALRDTADQRVAEVSDGLFTIPEAASAPQAGALTQTSLREFYVTTVRPFLAWDQAPRSPLANELESAALFSRVRRSIPCEMHEVLEQLDSICEERRQLALQERLHRWLHGWLFLHVPLSATLLVLAIVHIVLSVYY